MINTQNNIIVEQISSLTKEISAFTITASNPIITNNFLKSQATKAILIDLPICMEYEKSLSGVLWKTSIASITYGIRSYIKEALISFGVDKYSAGTAAGLAGGTFKYYATNQNPVIGALNNAVYELCNNLDFCANDPYVNIPFTIMVESLDAVAQTYLSLAKGDAVEALVNAAIGGAKIGAFIVFDVYGVYIPALETSAASTQAQILPPIGVCSNETYYTDAA